VTSREDRSGATPAASIEGPSSSPKSFGATRPRADLLLLAVAVVLAAWFAFDSLDAKSLWIDEALSTTYARQSVAGLFEFFVHGEANMALYHLMLHFWLGLGDSEVVLRSLSVLFALGTLPFAYALGGRLLSPRIGAVAALLLALNGVFFSFARETRSYSLAMFLIVAASFFFVRALDRGRGVDWVSYVLSAVLAVYTHLFAVSVLIAHFLSLAFWRGRPIDRRHRLVTGIAIIVLLSPAIAYVATGDTSMTTDPDTRMRDVVDLFRWYAVGNRPLLVIYLIAVVAAFVMAVRRWRSRGVTAAWPELFLGVWIAVPIAVALIVSYTIDPIFQFRYLLVALPALVLLVADGIARTKSTVLFVLFLVIASGVSLRSLDLCHPGCSTPTQDFRGATSFVRTHARPGDEILFDPSYLGRGFAYYAGRGARNAKGGRTGFVPVFRDEPSRTARRAWVLADEGDPKSRRYRGMPGPLESGWRLVQSKQFEGRLFAALYMRRP
jgi:mannosyltransferase